VWVSGFAIVAVDKAAIQRMMLRLVSVRKSNPLGKQVRR